MTGTREELVAYRIDRAHETLDDARLLADQERWASCANRLYYACFYAVSALLLRHDLESSKHTGSRSFFNRYFVKTGEVSKELGKTFNDLYELRQEGDYVDLLHFEEDQVRPRVALAEVFVEEVASLAAGLRDEDENGEQTGELVVAGDDEQKAAEGEDATGESAG